MAAQVRQPIAPGTVRSIAMKDGNSINAVSRGMSEAMAQAGTNCDHSSLDVTNTCVRTANATAALHLPALSTTSYPRHMGVPMTHRTSKAFAGLATRPKRRSKGSDENDYQRHQQGGGAGQEFSSLGLQDRRLSFCHAPAGWKPFLWGSPIAINRSFLSCLDRREPRLHCV